MSGFIQNVPRITTTFFRCKRKMLTKMPKKNQTYIPPFTAKICPVTHELLGLASHKTASVTSLPVPILPGGMACSISSLAWAGRPAVISVSMSPGATAFTRILREASSLASVFVGPDKPDLLEA
jgi:hypothetical protein